VHEAAIEEVVGRRIGVGFVEAPTRLTFRIRAYDGEWQGRSQMLQFTDEVRAMGEGAEET
jgi:hypothetical protein